jgi:hypothetical protein
VIVALLCAIGCSESSDDQEKKEYYNAYKPNANSQILDQTTFGDPDKSNYVYRHVSDGTGGYYFNGVIDDEFGVGHLDGSGELLWFAETGYYAWCISVLSPTSPVPNGLVVVGSDYEDDDEQFMSSHISLYSNRL